ncbi:MAG TPA: DUF3109 family protein, partial [Candidatus Wallbacteria bacterium]|nr:DUF3109 family protein [Candidatus Wallbacteria bacterium]
MFIYKNILVSEEILAARFACDLAVCNGECCSNGDAGAPLTASEAELFISSKERLSDLPEHIAARIKANGVVSEIFNARLNKSCYCTALDENGDCVFIEKAGGVYFCYLQRHATELKKPASCYLFPIREKRNGEMIVLNLHVHQECKKCYGPEK